MNLATAHNTLKEEFVRAAKRDPEATVSTPFFKRKSSMKVADVLLDSFSGDEGYAAWLELLRMLSRRVNTDPELKGWFEGRGEKHADLQANDLVRVAAEDGERIEA
jgi:hypothetical protein